MASLVWLFRGDLKDSHYSFEIDLSLCIWPPRYSVQSCVTVPRIRLIIYEIAKVDFLGFVKPGQILDMSQESCP